MILNDEYLLVDQLFDIKKDIRDVVNMITLKHNFKSKANKSIRTTYTIVYADGRYKWCLQVIKFNIANFFAIHRYT